MAEATYALSKFDVSEALSLGWQVFKENFVSLLVVGVIYFLIGQLPGMVVDRVLGRGEMISRLLHILLQIWNAYLLLGMTRYMLALIRGQKPEYAIIFNNTDKFVNFLIMYLRVSLVVIGGFILLVVPGIYFAFKYAYVLFLVADGKADGSEAFRMSGRMTEGRKTTMFLYGIVSFVLIVLGFIAIILPGLVAVGVASVGSYLMYDYALNHTSNAAAVAEIPAPKPELK